VEVVPHPNPLFSLDKLQHTPPPLFGYPEAVQLTDDAAFGCTCCCLVNRTPAPTPPTKITSPKIVAIIFPDPNFFFGLEVTEEMSGGAAEPLPVSPGGSTATGLEDAVTEGAG